MLVQEVNGQLGGYQLRLRLQAGAAIGQLRVTTFFELNPYSLPYLVPGKNAVTVEAERFGRPLEVEWRYAEGPDWKQERVAAKTFRKAGTVTIDVKGDKYPRNVALVLRVKP